MLSMRRIPLLLEPFGVEAIEYQAETLGLTPGEFLARAALYRLGTPRGPHTSSFLGEPPAEWPRAATVALEPASWAALEADALGAGITVAQLLAVASLQLAADIDSGRVATQLWAASA
jgi:hypothetical protein